MKGTSGHFLVHLGAPLSSASRPDLDHARCRARVRLRESDRIEVGVFLYYVGCWGLLLIRRCPRCRSEG